MNKHANAKVAQRTRRQLREQEVAGEANARNNGSANPERDDDRHQQGVPPPIRPSSTMNLKENGSADAYTISNARPMATSTERRQ